MTNFDLNHDYTIGEILDFWIDNIAPKKLRDTTIESYLYARKRAKKYWPEIEKLLLEELTIIDFQDFLELLTDMYGWSSINHIKCLYSKIYTYAIRYKLCRINPAKAAEVPSNAHRENGRPLTEKEIELIDKNKNKIMSMDWCIITFLRFSGIRKSELLNLKWNNINWNQGYIDIIRSKTKKGIRKIPLIPETKSVLQFLYAQHTLSRKKSIYVFCRSGGKPLTKAALRGVCERVMKITEITELTPHMFRHTFATQLIERGVDYKSVASMLGHKSVAFTMQTYVTHGLEYLRSGLMKISSEESLAS